MLKWDRVSLFFAKYDSFCVTISFYSKKLKSTIQGMTCKNPAKGYETSQKPTSHKPGDCKASKSAINTKACLRKRAAEGRRC